MDYIVLPLRDEKRRLFIRCYDRRCGMCKKELRLVEYKNNTIAYLCELDHFIPKRHGGADVLTNLWPCCSECHAYKSQMERLGVWCPLCQEYAHHPHCIEQYRKNNFDEKTFSKANPPPYVSDFEKKLTIPDNSIFYDSDDDSDIEKESVDVILEKMHQNFATFLKGFEYIHNF